MVNMNPNESEEQIANQLRAQAVRLWGDQRAGELEESIQQTARHLWAVGQETLHWDLEPGFYQ